MCITELSYLFPPQRYRRFSYTLPHLFQQVPARWISPHYQAADPSGDHASGDRVPDPHHEECYTGCLSMDKNFLWLELQYQVRCSNFQVLLRSARWSSQELPGHETNCVANEVLVYLADEVQRTRNKKPMGSFWCPESLESRICSDSPRVWQCCSSPAVPM